MSKVECYMCGELFEPNPEKVQAWGESGEDFEPTDWECPDCIKGQEPDDRDVDDGPDWEGENDYPYESRECPNCAGEDEDPEGMLDHCPYCNHGFVR